jgi:hypothetical protein
MIQDSDSHPITQSTVQQRSLLVLVSTNCASADVAMGGHSILYSNYFKMNSFSLFFVIDLVSSECSVAPTLLASVVAIAAVAATIAMF